MMCDRDCFNCKYSDCMVDGVSREEIKEQTLRDIAFTKSTYSDIAKFDRYNHSDKGKIRADKYNKSDKGKTRTDKYNQSEKGKERWRAYYRRKKEREHEERLRTGYNTTQDDG